MATLRSTSITSALFAGIEVDENYRLSIVYHPQITFLSITIILYKKLPLKAQYTERYSLKYTELYCQNIFVCILEKNILKIS